MVACTCPACGTPFIAEEHPTPAGSPTGLTKAQDKVLAFLETRLSRSRVQPSYTEIAEGVGFKSRSRINEILNGLVARGYIRRDRNRAISLVSRAG